MTELVNQSGQISQHELALNFLENAPTIELSIVKDEVSKYFKENSKTRYHLLNSKLVNYVQLFDTKDADPKNKVAHFMDFISESGFVANSKGSTAVIIEDDAVYTPMTDVRDIEIVDGVLTMYIGATYFTLGSADALVEKTISVIKED